MLPSVNAKELSLARKPLLDPASGYYPDFTFCYMSPCSICSSYSGSLCYSSNMLGTLAASGFLHWLFSLIEKHVFQILPGLLSHRLYIFARIIFHYWRAFPDHST